MDVNPTLASMTPMTVELNLDRRVRVCTLPPASSPWPWRTTACAHSTRRAALWPHLAGLRPPAGRDPKLPAAALLLGTSSMPTARSN